MTTWEFIKVMIGSATGPRSKCKGSRMPQVAACFWPAAGVLEVVSTRELLDTSGSPFLRFPGLDLSFEPRVFERERAERPSLRAFTRSLA